MPTNLQAATSTTGAVLDPSAGDGQLVIKTGATAGAQVNALSFAADGTPTFLVQPVVPQKLTLGTAQNTTSGNTINFTGIPSWAKRITLIFSGVSTNGTADFLIRIGPSGGVESTGYDSSAEYGGTAATSSTAFVVRNGGAANAHYGNYILSLVSGNTWVGSASIRPGVTGGGGSSGSAAGGKTTANTVTQLSLIIADTFDAGSVNILYEG